MIRILFICHGNICRSPMAEFVMKDLVAKAGLDGQIYVESAATSTEEIGNDIHYGTRSKLRAEGIPFTRRAARRITARDYENFDYIIGMDSYNMRNIERMLGDDRAHKVYRLLDFTDRAGCDIADPWYTGDFDTTFDEISAGCRGLLERIKKTDHQFH